MIGNKSGYEVHSFDDLEAVGVSDAARTTGVNFALQVTVADIGTNVVIRLEASVDGLNYFNLDDNNSDITITANGTYGYALSGCPVQYVRVRLVSISGGSPTVSSRMGAT